MDAGTGTVDSLGRLSITTPTAQVLVVVLAPETRGITAAVTTAAGTTTTFAGFADNSAALAQQRIVNLSTRTTAGSGDQVAIVGFVVTGLESKPVLLRAVGPPSAASESRLRSQRPASNSAPTASSLRPTPAGPPLATPPRSPTPPPAPVPSPSPSAAPTR